MKTSVNYYELLNCPQDCSQEELTIKANKMVQLAEQQKEDNPQFFNMIRVIRDMLTEPEKRNYYDKQLEENEKKLNNTQKEKIVHVEKPIPIENNKLTKNADYFAFQEIQKQIKAAALEEIAQLPEGNRTNFSPFLMFLGGNAHYNDKTFLVEKKTSNGSIVTIKTSNKKYQTIAQCSIPKKDPVYYVNNALWMFFPVPKQKLLNGEKVTVKSNEFQEIVEFQLPVSGRDFIIIKNEQGIIGAVKTI